MSAAAAGPGTGAVPTELKPIAPYLTRANELVKADPPIAYWCTYYALQLAMTLGPKEQESNQFLFTLMDKLETTKTELASNDAVSNDIAASAYVENFALKIFSQADKEDRAGKASRLTAKKFLAAANFLELLSIFGEISQENKEKIKYSKWKATDIAKAFREGRTPVPGPAGGLPEGEEDTNAPPSDQVTADEVGDLRRELAALEAADKATLPGEGAAEASAPEDGEPDAYPFPQLPTGDPSTTTVDQPSAPTDDVHPVTPGFPSFLNTPSILPGASSSSPLDGPLSHSTPPTEPLQTPQAPPSHQTSELPPPSTIPTGSSGFPTAVFPPSVPQLPSAPPLPPPPPPPVAQYIPPRQPVFSPPPPPIAAPAPPPPPPASDSYDPSVVTQIQKHAKWAISALNYDDYETARKELRLALSMLGD
ncbi:DUF605-domain-containing protein [Meredithblackwellia eburnea MCA 4105]